MSKLEFIPDTAPELMELVREKNSIAENFLLKYKNCLTESQKAMVYGLAYCVLQTPSQYRVSLRANVLEDYHVFDETHEQYFRILNRMRLVDPDLVEGYTREHDRKISLCKVPIYRGSQ